LWRERGNHKPLENDFDLGTMTFVVRNATYIPRFKGYVPATRRHFKYAPRATRTCATRCDYFIYGTTNSWTMTRRKPDGGATFYMGVLRIARRGQYRSYWETSFQKEGMPVVDARDRAWRDLWRLLLKKSTIG
jgi:hypothetical protein